MAGRLLRVALTGGIATGKSYCLARFAGLGIPTIDADTLARQAVAPGTSGFDAVRAQFGEGVVLPDGQLDRAALGRIVFADADARQALERIVHPVVSAAITRWFDSLARAGQHGAGIADIPLLYETGRAPEFDVVVVAACRPDQQRARLMARSNLSGADADQRIAAQLPIEQKAELADYVIDTSGTFEETDAQVRSVWSAIAGVSPL